MPRRWLRTIILSAMPLIIVGTLTACAYDDPLQAAPPPVLDEPPLLRVGSECDEHGNRVYKWTDNRYYGHGGISVVGADPTCKKAPGSAR